MVNPDAMSGNSWHTTEECGFKLISVTGEVELSWSQYIRSAVLDAPAASDAVAVDLSAVSYIDTSGVAALVECFQQCRRRGKPFALIAVSDRVRAVLELAWLDQVFPLFETIQDAANSRHCSQAVPRTPSKS